MSNQTSYVSPEFRPSGAVSAFRDVPRFGNTAEFSDFVLDDGDADGYFAGLFFVPVLMTVLTLLWFTVAFVCKCRHPERLPCLAGKPLKVPAYGESGLLNKSVRGGFVFFVLFSVGTAIWIMTGEHATLNEVVTFFRDELSGILTLVSDSVDLLVDIGKDLVGLQDAVAGLLTVVADLPACVNVTIPGLDDVNAFAEEIRKADLGSYVEPVEAFQTSLNDGILDLETEADNLVDDVDKYTGLGLNVVGGYLIVVELVLLTGALLAWCNHTHKWYVRCQQYLIMPLSCFTTLVCLIFAAIVAMVLTVVSDACTGGPSESPEGTMSMILNNSDSGADIINYYIIDGCRGFDPNPVLGELFAVAETLLGNVTTALDAFDPTFVDQCSALDDVYGSLKTSSVLFEDIIGLLGNATQLTSCSNLNPIFVGLIHDGMCDRVPGLFSLTFNLATSLWVCGLLMFLLRSALKTTKDGDWHDNY